MTAYLDNAATTMVSPAAANAAMRIMTECYGNPSSTHAMGRAARGELESSRGVIASALGSDPAELYFTSGGTESDNWAVISGALSRRSGKHVISSAAEHEAVLKSLETLKQRGFEVELLKPEPDGSIGVEAVLAALRPDTALISLMLVNNETGAITDIAAIAGAVRERSPNALIHTDAVQAFLKVNFTVRSLGVDMLSVSGHKVHGPKGVGALYIRKGLKLQPLIVGGGQEGGLRSGTEALPQIAAFAAAAGEGFGLVDQSLEHMSELRARTVERLLNEIPGLVVTGGGTPHILSISLPGFKSEVLMNYLEARGVFVARSSACKRGGRSHVLTAIGLSNELIDGALRLSFSRYTTMPEVDYLCDTLRSASGELFRKRYT